MKKLLKITRLRLIFIVIILLILFGASKTGQVTLESIFLTSALATEGKFTPINLFTNKPSRFEVYYESGNETIAAYLWIPNEWKTKYPAAVLDLGIDIDRKDPRVQKVAESFARSGIIVLTPNMPSVSQRRLNQESPSYFIDSFEYLEKIPKVDKSRIGLLGFCASGGVSLLAAENDRINQRVNFIVTVNPYYDIKSLYKAITTRKVNGQTWIPHFKTVEIYNKETIFLLEDSDDRQILRKYLVNITQKQLSEGTFPKIPENELKKLSAEGRRTLEGLTNKDPEKSDFYLENATDKQKKYVEDMSPSNNINKLKAKVFILLDKYNIYLPQSEGLALKQSLPKEKYYFTQTHSSTQLGRTVNLGDKIQEAKSVIGFLFKFFLYIS